MTYHNGHGHIMVGTKVLKVATRKGTVSETCSDETKVHDFVRTNYLASGRISTKLSFIDYVGNVAYMF